MPKKSSAEKNFEHARMWKVRSELSGSMKVAGKAHLRTTYGKHSKAYTMYNASDFIFRPVQVT